MDFSEQPYRNPGAGMATIALIMGIASYFTILSVIFPLILGGLAILFACLSKGYGKKMLVQAKIGLFTGLGGILLTVVVTAASAAVLLSHPDRLIEIGREYDETIESMYHQSTEEIYGTSFEDMMKDFSDKLSGERSVN